MAKILIVDDEATTRNTISWYLQKEGFTVVCAENGEVALQVEASCQPDLIVLDIMLPDISGWEIARRILRQVPIIFLTALGQEDDILTGFNIGADDYITKPFSPRELVARIKVSLRNHGKLPPDGCISCPPFKINLHTQVITTAQNQLNLSSKEFNILAFLARHPNIIFSRENLILNIWGYDYDGDSRVIDTTIKRLRHKLGTYRTLLKTVRGVGYMLEITNEQKSSLNS
ncbi:response regulator transcription factor [Sporomusa acidovorans]|uniref:Transcriptional regulatory protein WalR n=1 Tax=Sporomusa acidovorans (strain ATCC 49682 / DSM 3132 / Mol) TaxID=1123286 RepID=A0ABZ3J4R7_SPOA4|nr:response regulator transcription factor [Sporomusa acidovorans]OZC18084.1 transcriptional regulatory protein YycF [Sporomusa acidovorans DSM 3132]SDF78124.1 Transcriptional regulatory protein, C terminal [Sporomusa acidovorans]